MYTNNDTSDKELTEAISFGKWLRQRRRGLDLSQQAFADKVGCARITLSRIEADTLKPSKELALLLLEKVGLPLAERELWLRFARGQSGLPSQIKSISKPRPQTNLPASLTSFIGREKEQAEIIRLLSKHRLVTLIGSGGVGKTRLSLKVGEQLLENYPDGIWLVELAPLTNPELLLQTIAAIFDVTSTSNTPLADRLINVLHAKTILLILDNCEHLLDACAQSADTLLKHCPQLKILATSREAIGILGEASYRVPSLGLPDVQQVLEKLRDFESMRLFEERAQLVQTDFNLTLENASSVAQICSRLDGIPLAIELAAVHVNVLSPAEIAAQLAECFQILTGGSRTALPRQQTIRASIDWSWNLLIDSERTFLQRLSVFAGGWTLESAQAVCDSNALSLTNALVKKSLIAVDQETGRETRYHFHEMIRQYTHEKLIASGEDENIRARHLEYFLKLSEQIEPGLWGPQQVEWFSRTSDELDNLRAALEWAVKTDVEAGLYISSNLGQFWIGFQLNEGEHWLTGFLHNPTSENYPKAKAKATLIQGHLLADMEKSPPAYDAIKECVGFYRTSGDQPGEIDSLLLLSRLVTGNRRSELGQQAFTLARSSGDKWREARALQVMAWLHNDHELARTYWKDAIALYRQVGDVRRMASLQASIANYLILDGDLLEAQKLLDEALETNKLLNNKALSANILFSYGNMALIQGNEEQARACFQQHLTIHTEIGQELGWAHLQLGYVALSEGNLTEAYQILVETTRNFYNNRNKTGLFSTFEGLASLYVLIGKPEMSALLIGWADKAREEFSDTRWRAEQAAMDKIIVACFEKMGEVAFSEAYDEGKKMSLDEAIALVLEET